MCLMNKEECGEVEKGRNGADNRKLLSPSLQCLCGDQSRMLGVGCGTKQEFFWYIMHCIMHWEKNIP